MNSHRFRPLLLAAVVSLGVAQASAQVTTTGRPAATAELTITANVVPALYVRISTGSGGAMVREGVKAATGEAGASSLDFGTLDGMGTGRPAAGVSVNLSDPDGALYTTPITLTPYFSGFASQTATITVVQDQSSELGTAAELREGVSPSSVSTVGTAAPSFVTSTATNGSPLTRYVGLFIKNTHELRVSESLRAKLVYVITVP
jgi:hypothetical protein